MSTKRDGFTLIELTLAMLFIGLLSISIVLIISNTVTAFQRGMKLSRVNSTGTDLVDDMRASIQSSSARGLISSCYATIYSSGTPLGPQ
jgi:type II secretory pathway pseudopilin PulG